MLLGVFASPFYRRSEIAGDVLGEKGAYGLEGAFDDQFVGGGVGVGWLEVDALAAAGTLERVGEVGLAVVTDR